MKSEWKRFRKGELRCWVGGPRDNKAFIILHPEENGWHTPYGEPGVVWALLDSGSIMWVSGEYIDEWSVPIYCPSVNPHID